MDAVKPIFVIESNDFVATRLREVLGRVEGFERVQVVAGSPQVEDSAVIVPSYPLRAGRIFDQISALLADAHKGDAVLRIGSSRVDVAHGLYYPDAGADVLRLTEKEVALLVLLARAGGEPVAREVILDEVWRYAEGVETHTLETHIYRLRQKIEKDPARPEVLKTSDAGYFLAFERV